MRTYSSRGIVFGVLLAASLGVSACRRTFLVVPRPATGYSAVDTLRGRSDGRDVRVTFHFDTRWRVDTVTRLDTLWVGGTRVISRVDTLRLGGTDTVYRRNPLQPLLPGAPSRSDTVRVSTSDTIRTTVHDTVLRSDTVRVAGRRLLFVPPGSIPPRGSAASGSTLAHRASRRVPHPVTRSARSRPGRSSCSVATRGMRTSTGSRRHGVAACRLRASPSQGDAAAGRSSALPRAAEPVVLDR